MTYELSNSAHLASVQKALGIVLGPPEVAIFGDSRSAHLSANLTNHDTFNAIGAGAWANVLSNGQFHIPADLNFGVAGNTTTQMLARVGEVRSCRAETVVIFGGTNDRNTGADHASAAVTIANLKAIIETLVGAGKRVLLMADTPRGNASYPAYLLSGNDLKHHNQVRRWTLDYAARMRGVRVVDLYSLLNVPTASDGRILEANSYDGVHLSSVGASLCGAAIAAALKEIYPRPFIHIDNDLAGPYDAVYNPRGSLIPNPTMAGTGGTKDAGSTGNLADSCTSTRDTGFNSGSITSAFAKVARSGNKPDWQQLTLGGTAGPTAGQMEIYQTAPNGNFAEGDIVRGIAEVEIDAGMTGIFNLTARVTRTVGGAPANSSALHQSTDITHGMPSGFVGANRLLMVTRPFVWPAGSTTSARMRMVIQPVASAAVSAVIRFNMDLRKVPA